MRAYKSAVFATVVFTLCLPVGAQEAKAVEVAIRRGWIGRSISGHSGHVLDVHACVETDVAYRRAEGRIHALSLSTTLVCPACWQGDTVCRRRS